VHTTDAWRYVLSGAGTKPVAAARPLQSRARSETLALTARRRKGPHVRRWYRFSARRREGRRPAQPRQGADSVELKLTVPESDQRSAVEALDMDPIDAQIRQVHFFDTPDVALNDKGVVVRARRVQGKGDDTVVPGFGGTTRARAGEDAAPRAFLVGG
jgi:hypothetical protein